MRIQQYIFWGLLIFFYGITIPPVLINKNNSCWNNTALQLLFNMSEITEQLIQKNVREKVQKSSFLTAYIHFLQLALYGVKREFFTANLAYRKAQAIREIPEKDIPESIRKSISEGNQSDVNEFIKEVIDEFKKYDVDLYNQYCKVIYEKDTSGLGCMRNTLSAASKKYGNIIAMPYYYMYKIDENYIKAEKGGIEKVSDAIWATTTPLKTIIGGSSYELIGVAVHKGKTINSGHYVAYILDQFENPAGQFWYLCDDIAPLRKGVDPQFQYRDKVKPLPLDENNQQHLPQWNSQLRPVIAIYKKIESDKLKHNTQAIDTFAHALHTIITI